MTQNVYTIEVLDSGARFNCGEDEYILAAMIRAGCGPVYYGCFGGGCGICKMKVVSGSYIAVKKMSQAHVTMEEQQNDIVLICCVHPRDNMVITRI